MDRVERSTVALVNESFVKRSFPGAEILGRRFRVQEETEMGWITIVGVVPDFRDDGLEALRNEEGLESPLHLRPA